LHDVGRGCSNRVCMDGVIHNRTDLERYYTVIASFTIDSEPW